MHKYFRLLKFAYASLKQAPLFTIVTTLTLALTMGVMLVIAAVANTILFKELPYPEEDKLVFLHQKITADEYQEVSLQTLPVQELWYKENTFFESMALVYTHSAQLISIDTEPREVVSYVTPEYFSLLNVPMVLGRSFDLIDGFSSRDDELVISEKLWTQYFNRDLNILDQSIVIYNQAFKVIGVVAEDYQAPFVFSGGEGDIWLPWTAAQHHKAEPAKLWFNIYSNLHIIAKVRDTQSLPNIQSSLDQIADTLRPEWTASHPDVKRITSHIISLREAELRDSKQFTYLLIILGGALLAIAVININNMFFSRIVTRLKSLSIHAVMGAPKKQLFSIIFSESIMISIVAIGLALLMSTVSLNVLSDMATGLLPHTKSMEVDWSVVLFGLGLSVLLATIFSLVVLNKIDYTSLITNLNSSGKGTGIQVSSSQVKKMIGIQIVLTTIVLIVTSLSFYQALTQKNIEIGVDINRLYSTVIVSNNRDLGRNEKADLMASVRAKLGQLDNVQVVASGRPPLAKNRTRSPLSDASGKNLGHISALWVSSGYFQDLGIAVVQGRTFSDSAMRGESFELLVSQATASILSPNESILGKTFKAYNGELHEVVGVTQDLRNPVNFEQDQGARIWFSLTPEDSPIIIQTKGTQPLTKEDVWRAMKEVSANLTMARFNNLQQVHSELVYADNIVIWSTLSLSVFTLILAMLGIYGVINFNVEARRNEIGIRMMLGAKSQVLLKLLSKEIIFPTILGICVAVLAVVVGYFFFLSDQGRWFNLNVGVVIAAVFVVFATAACSCIIPMRKIITQMPLKVLQAN